MSFFKGWKKDTCRPICPIREFRSGGGGAISDLCPRWLADTEAIARGRQEARVTGRAEKSHSIGGGRRFYRRQEQQQRLTFILIQQFWTLVLDATALPAAGVLSQSSSSLPFL